MVRLICQISTEHVSQLLLSSLFSCSQSSLVGCSVFISYLIIISNGYLFIVLIRYLLTIFIGNRLSLHWLPFHILHYWLSVHSLHWRSVQSLHWLPIQSPLFTCSQQNTKQVFFSLLCLSVWFQFLVRVSSSHNFILWTWTLLQSLISVFWNQCSTLIHFSCCISELKYKEIVFILKTPTHIFHQCEQQCVCCVVCADYTVNFCIYLYSKYTLYYSVCMFNLGFSCTYRDVLSHLRETFWHGWITFVSWLYGHFAWISFVFNV